MNQRNADCGDLGHDVVPGDGLEPLDMIDDRIPCPGDGAKMDRGEKDFPADDDARWPHLWVCWCCRHAYLQHPNGALTLVGRNA